MSQIIPIKELKNTATISQMCHESDEPVYITKNGYGDMVIMSMNTYENMVKRIKMYQTLLTSEMQIREGKVDDAKKSITDLRDKYGL